MVVHEPGVGDIGHVSFNTLMLLPAAIGQASSSSPLVHVHVGLTLGRGGGRKSWWWWWRYCSRVGVQWWHSSCLLVITLNMNQT